MPKVPTDYTKTIIYKLVHKEDFDNANIYIGSTTNFRQRKGRHKYCCNNEKCKRYNQKNYQSIRYNGGWDAWNMIEIEKYPCNDKREAEAKEENWRTHFNAVLNSQACSSLTNNKTEYNKKYHENNKEKITKNSKDYRDNNKEKIVEYRDNNKEKIAESGKEYRVNNKEKIAEYAKKYCEINKEKRAERSKIYRDNNKEYVQLNKEKINQQRRENYAKNKEQNN